MIRKHPSSTRSQTVTIGKLDDPLADVLEWTVSRTDSSKPSLDPKFIAVFVPAVLAFVVAMLISIIEQPLPNIHDDFGNLLIADTLFHLRLTNPVPPASESLQTFHTIIQPTYASKYPIGTGLFLAIGMFMGNAAIGLWILSACAAASIAWMTLGLYSARWGMYAGLMTAIHPFWQNGWSQEFTTGWLAVVGIALIIGGALRIKRRSMTDQGMKIGTAEHAFFLALGCICVLFSRPFEGGLVAIMVTSPILFLIVREHWWIKRSFWIAATPALVVIALGVCFQLQINKAVTGSYTKLPYQLHEEQYAIAPPFRWQAPIQHSIEYRFDEQREFNEYWSLESYRRASSFGGYAKLLGERLSAMQAHWGIVLFCFPIAITVLPRARRRVGGYLLVGILSLLLFNCVPWVMPHYVAPLIPIAILLTVVVLRRLIHGASIFFGQSEAFHEKLPETENRVAMHRLPRTRVEVLTMSILMLGQIISLVATTVSIHAASSGPNKPWAVQRSELESQLARSTEKSLVLVRYQTGHNVMQEWVFNGASPETQKVVWARWGDTDLNKELLQSYPQRRVWILDIDSQDIARLTPYRHNRIEQNTR